jgi:hypothetical protein
MERGKTAFGFWAMTRILQRLKGRESRSLTPLAAV